MKASLLLGLFSSLTASAVSTAVTARDGLLYNCTDFTHAISASATNINLTDMSPLPISGTWTLSFRYCEPKRGPQKTGLQVLVHGASYTKDYWNFPAIAQAYYSYVRFAAAHGYATLSYDRLGNGLSDHPDPVNVVQTGLQIAIATQIISLARSGVLVPPGRSFTEIIHVGHSYGSVISNGVLATSPSSIDIAVLTGYTHRAVPPEVAAMADLMPAATVDPARFGGLNPNYLTTYNITSREAVFYGPTGSFSPFVAQRDEATKGTFAVGELTTGPVGATTAPNYTGHIGAFLGDHDILNCDPGCTNAATEHTYFPNATYEYTIIPFTGHCLNLHFSALPTYDKIQAFLFAHGF